MSKKNNSYRKRRATFIREHEVESITLAINDETRRHTVSPEGFQSSISMNEVLQQGDIVSLFVRGRLATEVVVPQTSQYSIYADSFGSLNINSYSDIYHNTLYRRIA